MASVVEVKDRNEFSVVVDIEPETLPDGSLNEDLMLEKALEKIADFNELHPTIQEGDVLLGFVLSEEEGVVLVVARFERKPASVEAGGV